MDGWITIGTKLDTKDLEKGLKKAESDLKRYETETKRLTEQKAKIEFDNSQLQETINKYDALQNKANEHRNKLVELKEAGFMWMTTYDDTERELNEINQQIAKNENGMIRAGQQIDKNNLKLKFIDKKLKDNASNQSMVTEQVKQMNTELQKSRGFDNVKASIDGISNKMSGIIKKAIKWGLAVFSIRSAYSFVRNAISTISQYDTQMATNIEYIRWALAMTLKPVVEYIVNLAVKLLGILRAIIKYLFNYDIFANAGADAFMKAKKSTEGVSGNLGKATKQAKELNKQLASFDEMNILGDNTKMAGDTGASGGTSGAGGGLSIPTEIPDIELKFKINWQSIYDAIDSVITWAKKKVKGFFDEISGRWIKTGEELGGTLGDLSKLIGDFFRNVGEFASTAIDGIGRVFKGLVKIIQGIFSGDINEIIRGALDVILGLFEMMVSSVGLILNGLVTIFKAPFVAIIGIVKETIADIKEKFKGLKEWFGKLEIGVKWSNLKKGLGDNINKIKTTLKNMGTTVGKVVVSAFKTVFNKMVSAVESNLNKPINAINSMIGTINKLLPKSKELSKLKTIKLPRLAKGGIINMPSVGVPVGNAIAGERGAEGVIPLTDSQQMALLGEAIGKYININATVPVYVGNRQIAREIKKINAENDFAYNR